MKYENFIWQDKKRPIFGLPISFTTYTLLENKLIIDSGILATHQEEIKLYRILDFNVERKLFQRLFNVGDILIRSGDASMPKCVLKDVKNPFDVKEIISKKVEEERNQKRVRTGEYFDADDI